MVIATLGITAAVTLAGTGALAQQIGGGFGTGVGARRGVGAFTQQFQQAGTIGVATGRGITILKGGNAAAVAGRPISATEARRSVQTLGDGTEISTSDSNLFYRDSRGRTRVEETSAGRTTISIVDPVARVSVTLNTANKTARRLNLTGASEPIADAESDNRLRAVLQRQLEQVAIASTTVAQAAAGGRGGRGGRGAQNNTVNEDLGVQSVNGVLANGTRSTLTIPQGQIGNNRDIHVVYERWYSEDLQMLVKTVNSDPRFGESTYELTNISRDEPDPALFQIPPDYTVIEPAGRGGRGATAPVPVINK